MRVGHQWCGQHDLACHSASTDSVGASFSLALCYPRESVDTIRIVLCGCTTRVYGYPLCFIFESLTFDMHRQRSLFFPIYCSPLRIFSMNLERSVLLQKLHDTFETPVHRIQFVPYFIEHHTLPLINSSPTFPRFPPFEFTRRGA